MVYRLIVLQNIMNKILKKNKNITMTKLRMCIPRKGHVRLRSWYNPILGKC